MMPSFKEIEQRTISFGKGILMVFGLFSTVLGGTVVGKLMFGGDADAGITVGVVALAGIYFLAKAWDDMTKRWSNSN